MNTSVSKTIEALKKNNIKARYFEDGAAAVKTLLQEISHNAQIGIGGSMTVKSLGIPEMLKDRGNLVHFHWLESTPESMDSARRSAAAADIYLTSTNALTEKGQLVNIDGVGNRVAAMVYGPKKVYVLCGINKIVSDLDSAVERIQKNAFKNARRLKLSTPCAANESCSDCQSPQRMCNVTTIINKKPGKIEMEVLIIGEDLGF